MSAKDILTHSLYLLAMINPISKICILSVFSSDVERREMRHVVVTSTAVALGILLVVMLAGDFILREVFRVELYSLRVAGGAVLFWVGFKALTKGVFFEVGAQERFRDLSIVPLASPMIAGPATIAASLSLAAEAGLAAAVAAMAIAVGVNMLLMLASRRIGAALTRYNVMGALIRITGLIVTAIAVQMALKGLAEWGTLTLRLAR